MVFQHQILTGCVHLFKILKVNDITVNIFHSMSTLCQLLSITMSLMCLYDGVRLHAGLT